ncbi:MAG: response regulator [Deltaproteobacteria bacterium]|nr:response regulator [Deltaproteobacteria bacterium]
MDSFSALVVDDEEAFLETVIKRLRKRNVNASGAKSGEEALHLLEQHPADVVVLDVRMPGIDGIQTLREIKQNFPLVEVVMLTGHASTEVAIEGMEIGAFDYLMKPVDIDELVFKLQDAYKKKLIQEKKIKNLEKLKK